MQKKPRHFHVSLEVSIAILIALTSLATAMAAWRTNVVNSQSSSENREGLIIAIKTAAAQGEDWRKVYEEAGYTRDYLVELSVVEALESSGDSRDKAVAANMRQYLLPGLNSLANSIGDQPGYRKADGTIDTQKRFNELWAQDKNPANASPPAIFNLAVVLHKELRFLMVGVILLAISLFWLGMAEISPRRFKVIALVVGVCGFLGTLGYFGIVEAVFVLANGGLK